MVLVTINLTATMRWIANVKDMQVDLSGFRCQFRAWYFVVIFLLFITLMTRYSDDYSASSTSLLSLENIRNVLEKLGFDSFEDSTIWTNTQLNWLETYSHKVILFWYRPYGGDVTQPLEFILEDHFFEKSRKSILQQGFNISSPMCGSCYFTYDRNLLNVSDAVVFHDSDVKRKTLPPTKLRKYDQSYVWWLQDSGSTVFFGRNHYLSYYFNYTMYVQRHSDIFAPYATLPWILKLLWNKENGKDWMREICFLKSKGKLSKKSAVKTVFSGLPKGNDSTIAHPYLKIPKNIDPELQELLKKKTRLTAWIVSNCGLSFGSRLRYNYFKTLDEAGLKVDVFGECGSSFLIESRWDPAFFEVLSRYKFYLAMANSFHCDGFIPDQVWYNALYSGAVPIIFGPHPDDVAAVLPPHSYIHAETFPNRTKLVNYLDYLDKNVTAYAEYLEWRTWTKYLDKYGNFHQIIDKRHRKNTKHLSREKIKILNKYAEPVPAGFCALCRKLNTRNRNVVGDIRALLLSNRPECFDEKLASRMAGLRKGWL